MLLGRIGGGGSHYVVSLDAENSQTGDTIANEQFEVEGKEQVLQALGSAGWRLPEKLGESPRALRKYSLGVEQHSKADYIHAIDFYKRAIEIDPNFALAHARLAYCYNNTNQF